MKHLKALVMMQLKDKLNFGLIKNKKSIINKLVFFVLRFLAVGAIAYLFFFLDKTFHFTSQSIIVDSGVLVIVLTIIFILSTLSCAVALMKTLYFAPDNRVLITFPVKSNLVFLSKLIVFYIFELIKSLSFLLPIFLAYGIACGLPPFFYFWVLVCTIFVAALPVLLGALLSMPLMLAWQLIRKKAVIGIILFLLIVGIFVYLIVSIIMLIPQNINLINDWQFIQPNIKGFLDDFRRIFAPFDFLTIMIIGKRHYFDFQLLRPETFIIFTVMLCVIIVLFLLVYMLSRPLFFTMTSKPFEYEKKQIDKKVANKRLSKKMTFIHKELLLNLRTSGVFYSLFFVYIAVPIMILLLNKIFGAMNTRLFGTYMTFAFNILIILLPLLAGNSYLASIFSKEGKAGYVKRTKPVKAVYPLFCKLMFPLTGTLLSLIATVSIFQVYAGFKSSDFIFILLTLFFICSAHIFWSAELDIMNPLNEQYDTSGESLNNPNENKAVILAFLLSFIIFAITLFLFNENKASACLKLFLIATVFAISRIYMFFSKIKLYYAEKQG